MHTIRSSRAAIIAAVGLAACAPENRNGAPPPDPADSAAAAVPAPDSAPGVPVESTAPPAAGQDTMSAQEDPRWTAGDTRVTNRVEGTAVLRAVRAARHEEFDRIVYEFERGVPGYRISYIDRPVRQCGSGDVVPFEGDAWLSMVFEPSDAHTQEGRPTVAERSRRPALPNIIELKLICDFEAQVEWVAGVQAPMEYRVLTLREPDRIVVDIRHPAIRRKPEEVYQ